MTTPRERFHPFYILPGTRVGTCVVRSIIGQGGGQVAYLADASDGRPVVLKISLTPKGPEGSSNRTMYERFLRQVGFFLQLRGTKGVADIFAHDLFPDQSESGHAYLVQEWIPGSINVLDWYRDKPHKLKAILAGWLTLANACSEMMRRGICHRDLKPENILVTPNGVPKIVDFDSGRSVGARSLTTQTPGEWPGTRLYLSPEVCQAFLSDPTTVHEIPFELLAAGDLHALGVIFYQILAGEYPFDEDAADEELLEQIAYDVPKRPSALNPQVPFGFDKVTMKLLEKDPEQRYHFGDEVVADLGALLATGEDWERPFQTPASKRHPPRAPTSHPSPGARSPTRTPRTCEGSAALELAPTAIVLAPPRALLRREPAPSALVSLLPHPAVPAPRRRLALALAAALALALMVPVLFFGQHGAAGRFFERGTVLVGQVERVVVTLGSMALSACTGLTGNLRGEAWLAKCPSGSRNVVDELDIHADMGIADILPGPNAIIPEDGRGLEVRDGPIEVKSFLPGSAKAVVARLIGVIHTGSDGVFIHFYKMQLFNGNEPEDAPPAGRIVDICAFASVRGYPDDLIPKAVDPPPDLHPGFMFVTTSQFGVHFAH